MTTGPAPIRVLAVCTANICRSPVAERVLQRGFGSIGVPAVVRSAGTHGGYGRVHADTIGAAARVGLDLSDHASSRLTHRLLDEAGPDLVVTMTRDHLYNVIATNESAWPHTFTLIELVRRAEQLVAAGITAGDVGAWVSMLGVDRRSADLMPGRVSDDIKDPYGRSRRHHRRMVDLIDEMGKRTVAAIAATVSTSSPPAS